MGGGGKLGKNGTVNSKDTFLFEKKKHFIRNSKNRRILQFQNGLFYWAIFAKKKLLILVQK